MIATARNSGRVKNTPTDATSINAEPETTTATTSPAATFACGSDSPRSPCPPPP